MSLKIALTKGRVEKQVVKLLKQVGLDVTALENKQRKLQITLANGQYEFILAKGPDVVTYLSNGVVDLGIVGSDILLEQNVTGYELLDLNIGKCQFILASTPEFDPTSFGRKVIGTKYPRVAQKYFAQLGQDVEIIKIEGSVELAPLVGLADAIIDITETGTTLKENNLQIYDYLAKISTRLIVNPLALKQKKNEIFTFVDQLAQVLPKD